MSERARAQTGAPHTADVGDDDRDDEISLRPYFETIWRYRHVVAAAMVIVCALFVIAVLGVWLSFPSERVATLRFRLLFEGAAQNKYPNGAPFSPAEIVGAPVIAEVFKTNELQRYGTYEDFKRELFVQQSSLELDQLGYEYQVKLADPKLSAVDRAKFEKEFKDKYESILDPSFSLSLIRRERFMRLPPTLAQKLLTDILATWAQQADVRKGIQKAQVPMLSGKFLSRKNVEEDDYLVAADSLRAKAIRIIRTIDELEKQPGALTLRTAGEGVSLTEIRAALEDCVRFDLEPLMGMIRSEGISKNARMLSLYASNMAFQLRLDKKEIETQMETLREALREYASQSASRAGSGNPPPPAAAGAAPRGVETPSLIPQLNDSFLDRIERLSALSQKGELEYRRKITDEVISESKQSATLEKELAYYEDLAKAVQGIGNHAAGSPELIRLINERSAKAFDVIAKSTTQLMAFYQDLSVFNLDPAARLYAITSPFSSYSLQSLSPKAVGLAFAVVILLTLILVPAGCLIHDARRKKPRHQQSGALHASV